MSFDTPQAIYSRLLKIEEDLARRQNAFESAARDFHEYKRDLEHAKARAFMSAQGTPMVRKAAAEAAAIGLDGSESEAEYVALKAVIDVLKTRAMVLMALLKSQV